MESRRTFPVQRRNDGSIDTGYYTGRAHRLHVQSLGEAGGWLMQILRSGYSAMSKTSSPSTPPSIISTRRAPSALWSGSSR